jgi:hypothetical protein
MAMDNTHPLSIFQRHGRAAACKWCGRKTGHWTVDCAANESGLVSRDRVLLRIVYRTVNAVAATLHRVGWALDDVAYRMHRALKYEGMKP